MMLSVVQSLDVRAFYWLYGIQGYPKLTLLMIAMTLLGSGWTLFAVLPMFMFAQTRRMAATLMGTVGVTAAVVFVLKRLVNRARPFAAFPGVHPLFGTASDYSFPSGHSAGSFTVVCFFMMVLVALSRNSSRTDAKSRILPLVGAAVLAILGVGIAASRVYLGFHFPTDVIAGAIIGTVAGVVGGRVFLTRQGLA